MPTSVVNPIFDAFTSSITSTTSTSATIPTTYTWTTDSFPVVTFTDKTEKVKEEVEKVNKHVDELEEDIVFFNETREQMIARIITLENENNELKSQMKDAINAINYLSNRIDVLEAKSDTI